MAAWRESWTPDSMHGARTGHETSDVSLELALSVEDSKVNNTHLAGISLDRKKFIDLLPHEIVFPLLDALGAPVYIINAVRDFYGSLQSVFKINGCFSTKLSKRSNGMLQGSSWSLQAAQALLSIWTRALEDISIGETKIQTGGFLDDNNFRCTASSAEACVALIQKAWYCSTLFDKLSAIQKNLNKTICFATTKDAEDLMKRTFCCNTALKVNHSFTLVGGQITTRARPDKSLRTKRFQTASARKFKKQDMHRYLLTSGATYCKVQHCQPHSMEVNSFF